MRIPALWCCQRLGLGRAHDFPLHQEFSSSSLERLGFSDKFRWKIGNKRYLTAGRDIFSPLYHNCPLPTVKGYYHPSLYKSTNGGQIVWNYWEYFGLILIALYPVKSGRQAAGSWLECLESDGFNEPPATVSRTISTSSWILMSCGKLKIHQTVYRKPTHCS